MLPWQPFDMCLGMLLMHFGHGKHIHYITYSMVGGLYQTTGLSFQYFQICSVPRFHFMSL